MLVVTLLGASVAPAEPAWWSTRGVFTNSAASDYSPVLMGQLQWLATNAYDEMVGVLGGPATAWTDIESLLGAFGQSAHWQPINNGQLKSVSSPFYDRLIEVGYASGYPWTVALTDDVDFALANLGQLKHAFDFDAAQDADADGLADMWEVNYFGNISAYGAADDPDSDTQDNAAEFAAGTDPTVPDDLDEDGMADWWELHHFETLSRDGTGDNDSDGVSDLVEFLQGRDPTKSAQGDAGGVVQLAVYTLLEGPN